MSNIKSVLGKHGISAGDHIQRKAIQWNNSKDHKVLGFLGARAIGVIVKPIARIADVAIHVILAVGKITGGTLAAPVYIALRLKNGEWLDTSWTVKQGLLHLGFATVFFADIFVSPITNFISPNICPIGNKLEVTLPPSGGLGEDPAEVNELQAARQEAQRQRNAADAVRQELLVAQQELLVAQQELGAARQAIHQQTNAAENARKELGAVKGSNEDVQIRIEAANKKVSELEKILSRNQNTVEQLEAQIAKFKNGGDPAMVNDEMRNAQNEKALVDKELKVAMSRIEQLTIFLGQKDDKHKEIVNENQNQAKQIQELSKQLQTKDITNAKEKTELQARVDAQFKQINEQKQQNEEQAVEITRLKNLLQQKEVQEVELGNKNNQLSNSLLQEGNKTAQQENKIKELDEASKLAEKKAQEAEKQASEAMKEMAEVKGEVAELKSQVQNREEYIEELVLESVALIKNRMIEALEGEKPKSLPPKARFYIWQNKDHQDLTNLSESLDPFGPMKFEKALLAKKNNIFSGLAEYRALKNLVGWFENNLDGVTVQDIKNAISDISKEELQEIAEEQQLLDDSESIQNTNLLTVSFVGSKEASPREYLNDLKMHLQIKLAQIHHSMDYLETNLERAKKTKLVDREVREKAERKKKEEENLQAEAAANQKANTKNLLNQVLDKARDKIMELVGPVKMAFKMDVDNNINFSNETSFQSSNYTVQQLATKLKPKRFEKYKTFMNEYLASDEGKQYEQFRGELFLN